jgi:hypothetical protein
MDDIRESTTQLLEHAFRDMLHADSLEARVAGETRAIEIGRAHYNFLAEFVVKQLDLNVRHAGLKVAAAAEGLRR